MIKNVKINIPQRVIEVISGSGIQKGELAYMIGIYPARLSEYFKGRYNLPKRKMELLAKLLNKNPKWLFGNRYANRGV